MGMRTRAVLMSFLHTARLRGLNPETALKEALDILSRRRCPVSFRLQAQAQCASTSRSLNSSGQELLSWPEKRLSHCQAKYSRSERRRACSPCRGIEKGRAAPFDLFSSGGETNCPKEMPPDLHLQDFGFAENRRAFERSLHRARNGISPKKKRRRGITIRRFHVEALGYEKLSFCGPSDDRAGGSRRSSS